MFIFYFIHNRGKILETLIYRWWKLFNHHCSNQELGGGNPINRFNPTTFLCLSQARSWIYNIICHGLFCVQWVKM